jgi:hypothetical protein
MYVFLGWRVFPEPAGNDITHSAHSGSLLGPFLVIVGLVGFLIAPYFAVARHMRCYVILALISYTGLSMLVWRSGARVPLSDSRASADQPAVT